jgi:hypothetical protein
VVEHTVKELDKLQLEKALVVFEALAEGTSAQLLLRSLSEEVAMGRIALAEGVAALTHGRLTLAVDMLLKIQAAVLVEDLLVAHELPPSS